MQFDFSYEIRITYFDAHSGSFHFEKKYSSTFLKKSWLLISMQIPLFFILDFETKTFLLFFWEIRITYFYTNSCCFFHLRLGGVKKYIFLPNDVRSQRFRFRFLCWFRNWNPFPSKSILVLAFTLQEWLNL